jgi:hypothetical protein
VIGIGHKRPPMPSSSGRRISVTTRSYLQSAHAHGIEHTRGVHAMEARDTREGQRGHVFLFMKPTSGENAPFRSISMS